MTSIMLSVAIPAKIKALLRQEDREAVGEVYQDRDNMAALLLYRHGHQDQYHMVGITSQ